MLTLVVSYSSRYTTVDVPTLTGAFLDASVQSAGVFPILTPVGGLAPRAQLLSDIKDASTFMLITPG